jgi:hypothetical protein
MSSSVRSVSPPSRELTPRDECLIKINILEKTGYIAPGVIDKNAPLEELERSYTNIVETIKAREKAKEEQYVKLLTDAGLTFINGEVAFQGQVIWNTPQDKINFINRAFALYGIQNSN